MSDEAPLDPADEALLAELRRSGHAGRSRALEAARALELDVGGPLWRREHPQHKRATTLRNKLHAIVRPELA